MNRKKSQLWKDAGEEGAGTQGQPWLNSESVHLISSTPVRQGPGANDVWNSFGADISLSGDSRRGTERKVSSTADIQVEMIAV